MYPLIIPFQLAAGNNLQFTNAYNFLKKLSNINPYNNKQITRLIVQCLLFQKDNSDLSIFFTYTSNFVRLYNNIKIIQFLKTVDYMQIHKFEYVIFQSI